MSSGRLPNLSAAALHARGPFLALVLLLVILAATGGSARGDLYLLIVVRPLAMAFLAYGLWGARLEDIRANGFSFLMLGLIILLTLAHLIPLPPRFWAGLPGREEVVTFAQATDTFDVWRPVTMIQWTTWNAFYAELTVGAVLILASRLGKEDRFRLLPVWLSVGAVSGILGLLQIASGPESSLYFYPVSSLGSAIGLLANRNHSAVFLASLYPLLAIFAVGGRGPARAGWRGAASGRSSARLGIAVGGGIVILPMLLVVGSRAGLILGVIGLVSSLLLYRISIPARQRKPLSPTMLAGAVIFVVTVGGLAFYLARAEAIERLFAGGPGDELRFLAWPPIVGMAWKYFPIGSGIGSFVEVFQLDEPYALLRRTYFNHAHNDWLEVVMTAGLPGVLLLAAATAAWAFGAFRVFTAADCTRRDVMLGRAAAIIIFLMGLASIGDYPLRTPFLAAYFAICAVWLAAGTRAARETFPQVQANGERFAAYEPQLG
jgi:O-antigen ligase